MQTTLTQSLISAAKRGWKFSAPRRTGSRRRPQAPARPVAADALEDRVLMSANVLYDHSGTTFDADLFAANIESSLNGVVAGFGYAIMEDGQQGPAGGGGFALSQSDTSAILGVPAGALPFHSGVRMEIASSSKNFAAAALQLAIQDHPFADLDHPMAAYLPTSWTLGNQMETVSLRNLLRHDSGIGENYTLTAGPGNPIVGTAAGAAVGIDFNSFSNNDWNSLQAVVAYGVENTYANAALNDVPQVGGPTWYSNVNYALMRVIVPIISGSVDASETDPQVYADAFQDYLNSSIFVPAGVGNIQMVIGGALQARRYVPVTADPGATLPGSSTGTDQTLVSGAIGLKMTPSEMARALAYLYDEDSSPLSSEAIQEMKDQFMGFWAGNSQTNGNYGAYYGHNGRQTNRSFGSAASQARTMRSTIIVFPNNVQAAAIVNSDTIAGLSLSNIVQNAYDNSWPRVAVGGSSGDDTFVVDTDPGGNNLVLTITTATSTETLTAPVSVLEELTLVGYGGDDTFIVNRLPDSVELSIRGGFGSDQLDLTPPGTGPGGNLSVIDDAIHFHGGPAGDSGTDVLNIYDDQNGADHNYWLSTTAFDRTGLDVVTHARVEQFNLQAGWGDNVIRLQSLSSGDEAMIDAGGGNDVVVLGNSNLSGNVHGLVDIVTGVGSDQLILDDRNGTVADDFYVLQTGYFQSAVIPVIEWDTDSPPEQIILRGSNEDSTTNIQNVASDVRLVVNGRGGNDVINLHAVEPGGRAVLMGGSGNDTLSLTPTGQDLDTIEGRVVTGGGSGSFDRVELHDQQNSETERTYRFNNNRFDVIGSPFDRLTYSASVEQLHVYGGAGNDTFDVRRTTLPTLVAGYGNGGDDTFVVANVTRDLDSINGSLYFAGGSDDGTDQVILHDLFDSGNDNYSLMTDPPSTVSKPGFLLSHLGVENLTLYANNHDNQISVGGNWALQTTHYDVRAGGGDDSITVQASAAMDVVVDGGAGAMDHVHVLGTAVDDEPVLQGNMLTLGQTQVTFASGLEHRSLDTLAGDDLLTMNGVAGVNDRMSVHVSTTPGSGLVRTPQTRVNFAGLEDVSVHGNAGESDSLAFYGTHQRDVFAVNPIAAGTADSVVAAVQDGFGSMLLRLRDFSHVGVPALLGGIGADTFRVTVFPTTEEFPMRNLRLDGGTERPGARPEVDTLIMNYNPTQFTQLSPPATTPHGTVRLQHDEELLAVLYRNFESVLGNIL